LAIAGLLIACGGPSVSATSTTAGPTTPGAATLAWDAVTTPNLLGYRVYYGTAPGTSYIQSFGNGLGVGNVTTTTLTGLASGTTYYFAVTTVDTSVPQNESTYSNEVFAIIP
jgi:hypothetical protein